MLIILLGIFINSCGKNLLETPTIKWECILICFKNKYKISSKSSETDIG